MNEVGTLKKGLDIFMMILKHPNLTVLEIINALEINKSTTYRLVKTLEQNQFIVRTDNNRYQLSNELKSIILQNENMPSYEFDWKAVPAMKKLGQQTKETIYTGMLLDLEVVITQVINGQYATRTHMEIGANSPIHHNAIGKCILAHLEETSRDRVLNALPLETYTENTIVTKEAFAEELQKIREVGYSVDNEEGELGVRCIAAPIWKNNKVIAAVALTGPSVRISTEKDDYHANLVQQCAKEITTSIAQEYPYT
ncbi:IclR family transcriptional regulator [Terribacillus halophilus]|uniref:IclR family transcriptional regulator n=1 Tax=Terribacillus halophilus TaxID=361279 RepID=UPI0009870ED8|nr:IclR family transcriptional regulator [Terribacillus halophilus]